MVLIQISFLTTWPVPISSLNIIFCLIIFLTVIFSYEKGLVFAMLTGLLLELYSALPFGQTTLSLLLSVVTINFLYNNFFTNRSLYSLAILGFIGTIIHNLILLFLSAIFVIFGFKFSFAIYDFKLLYLWEPLMNVLILMIVFFTYFISSGRLKNYFLFPADSYEKRNRGWSLWDYIEKFQV